MLSLLPRTGLPHRVWDGFGSKITPWGISPTPDISTHHLTTPLAPGEAILHHHLRGRGAGPAAPPSYPHSAATLLWGETFGSTPRGRGPASPSLTSSQGAPASLDSPHQHQPAPCRCKTTQEPSSSWLGQIPFSLCLCSTWKSLIQACRDPGGDSELSTAAGSLPRPQCRGSDGGQPSPQPSP